MNHPRRRPTTVLAVLLATALGAVLALVPASPVSAHGGPGKIEVESVTPQSDGRTVDVRVRLTYAGDRDPVEDATVTVTGELDGAGGASPTFTPVTLAAGEEVGTFAGTVALPEPGNWSLRVTSVEPPATATVPVASAAPADGAATSTTVPSTTVPSTSGPSTSAPSSTDAEPESGGNLLVSGVVAAVVGAVVASGVALARSRRRSESSDAPADE